jgi:NADPH:quinone reductase-like Zn-dependent oxidoreductase
MRVVQFAEYGGPEVLKMAEREAPAAEPNQILLRVAAASVNPADFKWRAGLFKEWIPLTLPHVVGYDVAGTVTAVGSEVSQFKVGDRVVANVQGGYAEFAVAEVAATALIPDGIDFAQAAALPCAALTGVELIEEGIRPQAGQTVLVTGATGAVGRFALKAAVDLGAKVVAAVRPAYFDEAKALGAAEVIAFDGNVPAGMTFDHVADTVGGAAVAKLSRSLKPGGLLLSVGTIPIPPEDLPATPTAFYYHPDGARLAKVAADVASGIITMPVVKRLPLAEAAEAHRLMEAGGVRGKVILEP